MGSTAVKKKTFRVAGRFLNLDYPPCSHGSPKFKFAWRAGSWEAGNWNIFSSRPRANQLFCLLLLALCLVHDHVVGLAKPQEGKNEKQNYLPAENNVPAVQRRLSLHPQQRRRKEGDGGVEMSHRYGTRSTTIAARSRAPIAGKPLSSEPSGSLAAAVPPGGNCRHNPEAAKSAPPPRTNNGRRPLTPPSNFQAVDGGLQRGQEPTPATFLLPAKCAVVHNFATPPSAPASVVVPSTAGAAHVRAENHPPNAGESRRKRSRLSLSLSKRRAPSSQRPGVAPAVITPTNDSKGGSSCGAVVGCFPGGISPRLTAGCVGSARRSRHECPPPPPPPPPSSPPFVGLKNVGETCYVNAVLQALAACRTALKSNSGASASRAGGDGGKAWDRQEGSGETSGLSSAAPIHAADDDVGPSSAGCTVSPGVRAGTEGNPVFHALGKVLHDMEARNRTLFQRQQSPEKPVELLLSANPEVSVLAGDGSRERPVHPPGRKPKPGIPSAEYERARIIAPNGLVELIREGWLNAERPIGGATANSLVQRLGGGTAGLLPAMGDFGNGQACVSELLGKLLDVCAAATAAGAVREDGGELGGASVGGGICERGSCDIGSVCSLATAFRGSLCACTHCVECERDRTRCEEFTELALPPLIPPPQPPTAQPPSSKRVAAAQGLREMTAESSSSDCDLSKTPQPCQTLQSLVDAMLGRESLEGNNKVWCESCRQWNEAERNSSLCSLPGLLALHVRPGASKQSSPCPRPTATVAAAGGALHRKQMDDGAGGAGGWGGPCKTEQATATAGGGTSGNGELIERVLVVKSSLRCQSHAVEASGNGSTAGAPTAGERQQPRAEGVKGHRSLQGKQRGQLGESGDVFYDLIGAILHQGQTLSSGHYTFALHAGGPSFRSGDQTPTHHYHHPPSAGGTGRYKDTTSMLVQELTGEGRAGRSVALSMGCTKQAFALFDDAAVRWLSAEEGSALLRGGGGSIGDPFLVFYARRE